MAVVRSTNEAATAHEWALVLQSAGIISGIERRGFEWVVLVAEAEVPPALAALEAYERENPKPASVADLPEYGRTSAGFVVAAGLAAFYFVLAVTDSGRWFDQGTAYSQRILHGELWRTVTALTLHANLPHIIANAAACTVFVTSVCRALGPGLGLLLVLLGGALGNAINAIVRGSPHAALGASTAVFAAVGILAALQFVRRTRFASTRRHAWLPIAAGLALLAMLGAGIETDVLAHLFGFLAGGALGAAVAWRLPGIEPRARWGLAAAALAVILACWSVALR